MPRRCSTSRCLDQACLRPGLGRSHRSIPVHGAIADAFVTGAAAFPPRIPELVQRLVRKRVPGVSTNLTPTPRMSRLESNAQSFRATLRHDRAGAETHPGRRFKGEPVQAVDGSVVQVPGVSFAMIRWPAKTQPAIPPSRARLRSEGARSLRAPATGVLAFAVLVGDAGMVRMAGLRRLGLAHAPTAQLLDTSAMRHLRWRTSPRTCRCGGPFVAERAGLAA